MERDNWRAELTREELYAQSWAEPMTKVAQRQVGRVRPHPKLPESKPGQQAMIVIYKGGHVLEKNSEFEEVEGFIDVEKQPDNEIVVSEELMDPHPLVAKTTKSFCGACANKNGIVRPRAKLCLDVRVGKASIERAARITDALIKALEARGIELIYDKKDEGGRQLVWPVKPWGFL